MAIHICSEILWQFICVAEKKVLNDQGVTKRCQSLLTNSALVYESQCGGMRGGGVAGSQQMSTAVHITWHRTQINFGDLLPYLTYVNNRRRVTEALTGSLSWGWEGCVAYGSGSLVVVVEPATAQHIQTLSKHRSPVLRTAWAPPPNRGRASSRPRRSVHLV